MDSHTLLTYLFCKCKIVYRVGSTINNLPMEENMLRAYKLSLLTIIIPFMFSGCTFETWIGGLWKNNKYYLIGGIIILLTLFALLIKGLLKNKDEVENEPETEDMSGEEFTIEEDIDEELNEISDNSTTEYLYVEQEQDKEIQEEDRPKISSVIVSVKGEKIGKYEISEHGSIIGRDPAKSAIIISEPIVSKTHLKITPNNAEFEIEDLNSTNGTYIDGKRIDKTVISRNKTVFLGKKGNIAISFTK